MLSHAENELLTRIGPGTPMGDVVRQYWMPAFMSSELAKPDGAPMRLRLLGENLIAFRSTSGKIGLLAHACPHRGASLFYGRNESEGLRCVYHGWKFNAEGRCVDMPSEPPESNFKEKVCARAYPCRERNGIVWTYMGPRSEPPPLPDLEANLLPAGQWAVWTALRECNWVQALEGDIDTAHLGFLHMGSTTAEDFAVGSFDYYTVKDRAPSYKVVDTDYGTMYAAYRPAETDTYYWRFAHFLFPFYTLIPTGKLGVQIIVRAWVPLDDEHTMFWSMEAPATRMRPGSASVRAPQNGAAYAGAGGRIEYLPNTTDWLGRWRLAHNASNDHGIDREAQRTQSYTGIDGIHLQDQAITESMGPIIDRSIEHLGSSDAMVIRTRRRLMRAAQALREEGTIPPAVDQPKLYQQRSGGVILPRTADWLEATQELRKAFVAHPVLVS
jgi:phenylpropionate dioxygenase-like ring-hydroxylating dioxygenase large terminal subunit